MTSMRTANLRAPSGVATLSQSLISTAISDVLASIDSDASETAIGWDAVWADAPIASTHTVEALAPLAMPVVAQTWSDAALYGEPTSRCYTLPYGCARTSPAERAAMLRDAALVLTGVCLGLVSALIAVVCK